MTHNVPLETIGTFGIALMIFLLSEMVTHLRPTQQQNPMLGGMLFVLGVAAAGVSIWIAVFSG